MEEIRLSLHGFNNSQLRQRCEPTNHTVTFDGYHYRWKVFIDGKWTIQSIKLYDTYKQAYSHILFWLHKYNKEMQSRDKAEATREYFREVERNAEVDKQLYEISREYNSKTKEKVRQMIILKPNITNIRISELLDVSLRSIERHRKTLNL